MRMNQNVILFVLGIMLSEKLIQIIPQKIIKAQTLSIKTLIVKISKEKNIAIKLLDSIKA